MTYKFTTDFSYYSGTRTNISYIIQKLGLPSGILEIGVYEGHTTFWLAELLDRFSHAYSYFAVDPHEGSPDLTDVDFKIIHDNFIHNLKEYNSSKIKHIKKYSSTAMVELAYDNIKFDFVYIDGDHKASQVLTDLVLSWECLNPGGVILCDDATDWKFIDNNGSSSAQMSPRMAIETFIMCNWDRLQIIKLPDSSQTAFVKIA